MYRLLAASATLALFTSLALADNIPHYAGTKGTVTAWDETRTQVLEHRFCLKRGYTWDYTDCGVRLRDALKRHFCTSHPAGTYKYFMQVGDYRPYLTTLYCR
jgi:hypothetical protein